MEVERAIVNGISASAVIPGHSPLPVAGDRHVHQAKRKAEEANVASSAPKRMTASPSTIRDAHGTAVLPPRLPITSRDTRHGSCPQMAISLADSSGDEGDQAPPSPAVSAVRTARQGEDIRHGGYGISGASARPSVVASAAQPQLAPRADNPIQVASVVRALDASNALNTHAAQTIHASVAGLATADADRVCKGNALGHPGATGVSVAARDNSKRSPEIVQKRHIIIRGPTEHPPKERVHASVNSGATASPIAKRKVGRPLGSKNRTVKADPPYLARTAQQRTAGGSFVPNIANRPKRQPRQQTRWADEMINPGEQWLRKVPKPPPPLPPNPVDASIPDAPTFFPTEEEFRDPLSYIESIRPKAEGYGMAKIVPPQGWNPPPVCLRPHANKSLPTKKQALHNLMDSDEVYDDGRDFKVLDYKRMADRFAKYWAGREPPQEKVRTEPLFAPQAPKVDPPPGASAAEVLEMTRENALYSRLEREYWNVVDGGAEEAEVEYANDLDISEFWSGFPMPPKDHMDGSSYDRDKPCDFNNPDYYKTCGWNLNNLPFWPGSVLRFFRTHINGLTAPWLYLGMQFATFAWHNEDNYLYSLNYHHDGAPKQWYGVPGKHAKGFETCLAKVLGETVDNVSEHLYRITKMMSPVYLQQAKVPVCRLLQRPGQFVVTFPKAYHGGFSYGFNCGEAVNFAVPDWISYSRESTEAYRNASRMAALSHDKMVATLTMYLPDHDITGCELVVRELKRIEKEELDHRVTLELKGVQDPAKQGVQLPRFRLGLIERDTEEYDERRVCKTCKHTLFMTGVACPCSDVDVFCLRCVGEDCGCPIGSKYLLSWWTESDLSKFVTTAESYLRKLRAGRADEAAVADFRANINPF